MKERFMLIVSKCTGRTWMVGGLHLHLPGSGHFELLPGPDTQHDMGWDWDKPTDPAHISYSGSCSSKEVVQFYKMITTWAVSFVMRSVIWAFSANFWKITVYYLLRIWSSSAVESPIAYIFNVFKLCYSRMNEALL